MDRRCSTRRHRGSWDVVANDHTPGILEMDTYEYEVGEIRGEIGMRLLLGVTNITQRCSNCGWIETTTVTGKVEHVQGR